MNVYKLFDHSDIEGPIDGYSIVAPDKKTAHEWAQAHRPGETIEVFTEPELEAVRALAREQGAINRWLDLARSVIGEVTDYAGVRRKLAAARRCLDSLDAHFLTAEVTYGV